MAPFTQINLSSNNSASVSDRTTAGAANKGDAGRGHALKYLLVMDKGAADLSDIISHGNVAGKSPYEVLGIAVKLAECLRFVGDECNMMHGDVKSRNFVDRGKGFGLAIIDLDAAAEINGTNLAGQKVTSSGCLPPEQAAVVLYNRMQARRAEAHSHHAPKRSRSAIVRDAELKKLKEKLMRAIGEERFTDVATFSTQIGTLKAQITGSDLPATAPPNVVASHTYDMWGFGVLLYQLCTGRNLFDMDVREEVDDDELAKIAAWSDDEREKAVNMNRVEEGKGWPKGLISQLLSKDPEDRPKTWAKVIEALKAPSGGNSEILTAIEMNRVEDQKGKEELSAKLDKIAAQASEYAKRNEALHARTQAKMNEGFQATQQLMFDMNACTVPYVYEVTIPKDIAQEEVEERAEQEKADAAEAKAHAEAAEASSNGASGTEASAILKAHQASKDLKKRLNRAKRFLSRTKAIFKRTKEFAGSISELKDDLSVEKLKGVATQFKKGETYKLRLLCGISFEPIVEYKFTEKEYGPKMKKLAQVGSVIASCAIKLGTFATPVGKVAGFFGYPVPEIPVEKIEGLKSYLDEVAGETDTQGEWAALKEQAEKGMDLDAITTFGELVQKLIDAKRGLDWRGKLVQWPDPNNPGMVTFIDSKQYPKHTWDTSAVAEKEETIDAKGVDAAEPAVVAVVAGSPPLLLQLPTVRSTLPHAPTKRLKSMKTVIPPLPGASANAAGKAEPLVQRPDEPTNLQSYSKSTTASNGATAVHDEIKALRSEMKETIEMKETNAMQEEFAKTNSKLDKKKSKFCAVM